MNDLTPNELRALEWAADHAITALGDNTVSIRLIRSALIKVKEPSDARFRAALQRIIDSDNAHQNARDGSDIARMIEYGQAMADARALLKE